MRRWTFGLLLLLLMYPVVPSGAYALSCAGSPTIAQMYEGYDGVIVGKVESLQAQGQDQIVEVTVLRSFKGVDSERLLISENRTWGATIGPSKRGESYLFFLRKKETVWENPLCGGTLGLADAAEELAYLKDREIPLKQAIPSSEEQTQTTEQTEARAADESSRSAVVWWIVAAGFAVIGLVGYGAWRKRG